MKYITILLPLIIISCGQNIQVKNTKGDTISTIARNITPVNDSNVIKVFVDTEGIIYANNQTTTLNELDVMIKQLNPKNGMIYYSRDNIAGDPPKEAMQVIEIIARYSFPIQFYTDQNFTQIAEIR